MNKPEFGLASTEYARFRPTYPNELFEHIFQYIPIGNFVHALDIGSGTGISSEPLLEVFDKVTLLEPDEKLIKHIDQSRYYEVINSNIENYEFPKKSYFDLVTFGNVFYWTDGNISLQKIVPISGLVVAYRYDFPVIIGLSDSVLKKHLEVYWERYRHNRLVQNTYTKDFFLKCKLFKEVKIDKVDYKKHMDVKAFVGFITSTSYASSYLRTLDTDKARLVYTENLIRQITEAESSDSILVDFSLEIIIGLK